VPAESKGTAEQAPMLCRTVAQAELTFALNHKLREHCYAI